MHLPSVLSVTTASFPRRRIATWLSAGVLAWSLGLSLGTTPAVATDAPASPMSSASTSRDARPSSGSVVTTTTVSDPDDVDGRFDIAQVSHVVSEADRHHVWISYTVSTYPSWVEPRLDRRFRNFVLELNRDGHPGSEVNVRVSKDDGHIIAELISNATRQVIQRVQVRRPDDHSFTIMGPRRVLGARSYFWTSTFHTAAPHTLCGRQGGYPVTCQDSVPQAGWIRMNRSAWTPTRSDLSAGAARKSRPPTARDRQATTASTRAAG